MMDFGLAKIGRAVGNDADGRRHRNARSTCPPSRSRASRSARSPTSSRSAIILYQMAAGRRAVRRRNSVRGDDREDPAAAATRHPELNPELPGLPPEDHRALPGGRPGAALPERPARSSTDLDAESVPDDDALPRSIVGAGSGPAAAARRRRRAARGRGRLALPQGPLRQAAAAQKTQSVLVADFANHTGDPVFDGTLEPAFTLALEGASFVSSYNRNAARKVAAQLSPGATRPRPDARPARRRPGGGQRRHVGLRRQAGRRLRGLGPRGRRGDRQDDRDRPGEGVRQGGRPRLGGPPRRAGPRGARRRDARSRRSSRRPRRTRPARSRPRTSTPSPRTCSGTATGTRRSATTARRSTSTPNLGRAYAGLAAVESNRGRRQDAEKYYKEALARIDRMSDREKFRTRGGYYLLVRNPDNAIEEFSALVKQYPADTAGIANLAAAYFYKRDMPRALAGGAPRRRDLSEERAAAKQPRARRDVRGRLRDRDQGAGRGAPPEPEVRPGLRRQGALAARARAPGPGGRDLPEGPPRSTRGEPPSPPWGWPTSRSSRAARPKRCRSSRRASRPTWRTRTPRRRRRSALALAEARLALRDTAARGRASRRAGARGGARRERPLSGGARVPRHGPGAEGSGARDGAAGARLEPDPQAYAELIRGEAELRAATAREAISTSQAAKKIADTWAGRLDLGKAYLEAGAFARGGRRARERASSAAARRPRSSSTSRRASACSRRSTTTSVARARA